MDRIQRINGKISSQVPTLKKHKPKSKETIIQEQIDSLLPNNKHNVENPAQYLTQRRKLNSINKKLVLQLIYGQDYINLKNMIYNNLLKDPGFYMKDDYEMTISQYKNYINDLLFKLVKASNLTINQLKTNEKLFQDLNSIGGLLHMSLGTKIGVHYGLYSSTLMKLGTQKHEKLLERALEMKDLGCFLMTEMGHGSNVQGLLTTAHYLHSERCFVLNTPNELGTKFWIGNLGRTCNYGVCFANLLIGEINYGIHVFVVKIRDRMGEVISGITLGDCGPKLGMQGVDNGWCVFRRVKIPYDNFLDRFSQIDESGKFISVVEKKSKRFALQLSALSGGRLTVSNSSCEVAFYLLTIALRYTTVRKQFGEKKYQELTVINYPSVQNKLIPYFSKTLMYKLMTQNLTKMFYSSDITQVENLEIKKLHALCSFIKCTASYLGNQISLIVRELCGGHGYSSYSGIEKVIRSQNVQITWEGTNDVLIQQTAKFLLTVFTKYIQQDKIEYKNFKFLQKFEKSDFLENLHQKLKTNIQSFVLKSKDFGLLIQTLIQLHQIRLKNNLELCLERFNNTLDEDMNLFKTFNQCLPEALLDASYFYGDYECLLNGLNFINSIQNQHESEKIFFSKNLVIFGIKSLLDKSHYLVEVLNVQEFLKLDKIVLYLYPTLINDMIAFTDEFMLPDQLIRTTLGKSTGNPYQNIFAQIYADKNNFYDNRNNKDIMEIKNTIKLN